MTTACSACSTQPSAPTTLLSGARQGATSQRVGSSLQCTLATCGQIAQALRSVAADLDWERRPGVEGQAADFAQGHANAILARSDDPEREVVVGISLMAPAIRYPDHHHPPDEVYIVLSPGEWRQNEDEWHQPGVGGIVHNPSEIVHAMRSGDAPLLALWLHFRRHVGA